MKLTAIMAMIVAAGITVQAGSPNPNEVTVYVRNGAGVPLEVTSQAEVIASSMFATIGVKINWRRGEAPASGKAIVIELADHTPATEKPGALAYAKPVEGVHIVVFWDRMAPRPTPSHLLAHVLTHEITHILEGTSRHSDSGIMKAFWTDEDKSGMRARPMTFAANDVELIQIALKTRAAGIAR